MIGALFLGRSFHALDNEKPPSFLDDMDDYFNITAIRWLCPWMLYILPLIPSKKVHHFLHAQQRSYLYGRTAFDDYIHQYGKSPFSIQGFYIVSLWLNSRILSIPFDPN